MVNGQSSITGFIHHCTIDNSQKLNGIVVAEECDATGAEQRYKVDNIKKINGRNSNTAINGRSQRI